MLQRSLSLRFSGCCLLRSNHSCFGCHICLPHLLVDVGCCRREEAAEVNICVLRHLHLYVAHACLVRSIAVECAQTSINREIRSNLIGCTQLETEVILTSAHVCVAVVSLNAQRFELLAYHCHSTLERTESVFKLAHAAAARYREVELQAPFALIPCCLYGWDYGCVGNSLENLCGAVVLLSQEEQRICRSDGSRLVGILPVDCEVESLWHENHSCRVAVNTVKTYRCIACRILKKSNTLVCVCKDATGKCAACNCKQH